MLISFKGLTLFYIRNWSSAPWTGFDNYKVAVKIHEPIGQALLHSFWVTIEYTVLSVGISWLIGTAAAILMQDTFRGRGAAAHDLPGAVRAAGLRGRDHLVVHVPAETPAW